jgi:hypothetical protein
MSLERIEVKNPVGINTSYVSGDLPLEVWSDGNNVSFKNGKAMKASGVSSLFETGGVEVFGIQPYLSDNTPYWFVGTDIGLFRTEGGPFINVSGPSAPYNASADNPWNGGVLNGVSVLNNGVDVPQSLPFGAVQYEDLPNWPANTSAKILRPFKNYLVAMGVTKSSSSYPTMVKWSSPADPGQVPFTWDETDPKNDAGETSLADSPGAIVDGVKLRDSLVIYKEDSSYLMRYVGGVYIFSFQQLFTDIGMLATNCAVEFDGFHFVVGQGDVYVHNGVQKRSVIDGKNRELLFNYMDGDYKDRTFVVSDPQKSEMWICFTSQDAPTSYCDKAFVWNWTEDTWSKRDLPGVFCGAIGVVDPQVPDYWEADAQPWSSDSTIWASASYNASKRSLVLASPVYGRIFEVTDEPTKDPIYYPSYLERTGVSLGDNRGIKSLHSIIPHMSGSGRCLISVGTSDTQSGPITWKGPYPFDVSSSYKVDCKKVGRYVSVRFEFADASPWALNGYTVEMTPQAGIR